MSSTNTAPPLVNTALELFETTDKPIRELRHGGELLRYNPYTIGAAALDALVEERGDEVLRRTTDNNRLLQETVTKVTLWASKENIQESLRRVREARLMAEKLRKAKKTFEPK